MKSGAQPGGCTGNTSTSRRDVVCEEHRTLGTATSASAEDWFVGLSRGESGWWHIRRCRCDEATESMMTSAARTPMMTVTSVDGNRNARFIGRDEVTTISTLNARTGRRLKRPVRFADYVTSARGGVTSAATTTCRFCFFGFFYGNVK